jgi:hypothetical protein
MDVGINRNFHFGFTTRTSIPAVASAESVSCIRFHPKGSGRPERAVSGIQGRVSLCFQAIFLTPLRQLPSVFQIGFALPPHAIIRLAPAEPSCVAACFRTGAASDGSGPGEVCLIVEDQGCGIAPEKLERIFDRFQQGDASDSRALGGTGLGLALCRSIVEQHQGRIWAESAPGKGSRFLFTLPGAAPVVTIR